MTTLRELQSAFASALLEGREAVLADLFAVGGADARHRIAVHRNNILVSLTDALADAFPAVRRLVDDRFFRYVASAFVRVHPPTRPCLAAYGDEFPAFLAGFEACRHLGYLADVARLEWAMRRAAVAEDAAALAPAALGGVGPEDAPRLVLRLHPALGLVESPWPVDRVWRANRQDAADEEAIDLGAGGAQLEVMRWGGEVFMRRLDPARFAFRRRLLQGATLESAGEASLASDPSFPLGQALSELFTDGVVVAAALASPLTTKEPQP